MNAKKETLNLHVIKKTKYELKEQLYIKFACHEFNPINKQ